MSDNVIRDSICIEELDRKLDISMKPLKQFSMKFDDSDLDPNKDGNEGKKGQG